MGPSIFLGLLMSYDILHFSSSEFAKSSEGVDSSFQARLVRFTTVSRSRRLTEV